MDENIIVTEKELAVFDEDIHQKIADWLEDYISNKSGYCHKGFVFEINVTNIEWDKS